MARPQKNNAEYFSHDKDMRNDIRIKALRTKFGAEGYAVYNMLLELLTDCDHFELLFDDTTPDLLAGDFGIPVERVDEIISYMIKLRLFEFKEEATGERYLVNCKLKERLQDLVDRRTKWREKKAKPSEEASVKSIPKGKQQENGVFPKENTEKNEFSQSEMPQSKVNKTKVNKIKVINNDNVINEGSDFISRIYIRCFSRPPNRADLHLTENLIKEFGEELTERSFMKAREQLGDKITLAYIRGICSNEFNNVEKPNVRQTNARFPLPAGHSNSNNGKRGYSNAVWDSEPNKTAQDKQPPG